MKHFYDSKHKISFLFYDDRVNNSRLVPTDMLLFHFGSLLAFSVVKSVIKIMTESTVIDEHLTQRFRSQCARKSLAINDELVVEIWFGIVCKQISELCYGPHIIRSNLTFVDHFRTF